MKMKVTVFWFTMHKEGQASSFSFLRKTSHASLPYFQKNEESQWEKPPWLLRIPMQCKECQGGQHMSYVLVIKIRRTFLLTMSINGSFWL
jgi:hypothetical protein